MHIHLDLSTVEAFTLVADFRSFTHAAEALGITQAGVSMKLRRLEASLGRRLLNRTPRQVRLSSDGEAFLPRARALLKAQDDALSSLDVSARRLSLGISDYIAGPDLPIILAKMRVYDPQLAIQVRVGASEDIVNDFERGNIDVAIIRRQRLYRGNELLFHDSYGWFGSISELPTCSPLRLVSVDDACGVRSIAISLLRQSKIDWVDSFIGGGVATALAAATAGIGIAPLPKRLATIGLIEVGERLGLPPLPKAEVTMLVHTVDVRTKSTLREMAVVFQILRHSLTAS